jgi:hypothetical protein
MLGYDGKVLDDAQGYGYKSAEKVRVAHWYKTGGREKQRDKERIARKWLASHRDVKQAYCTCSIVNLAAPARNPGF